MAEVLWVFSVLWVFPVGNLYFPLSLVVTVAVPHAIGLRYFVEFQRKFLNFPLSLVVTVAVLHAIGLLMIMKTFQCSE